MKRYLYLVALGLLSGCMAPDTATTPIPQDKTPFSVQATYDTLPKEFMASVIAFCLDKNETLSTVSDTTVRCERLAPPRLTAALILQYDGHVEDLPKFITDYTVEKADDSFLVSVKTFIDVPQRGKAPKHVIFDGPRARRPVEEFLKRTGGSLL